MLSVMAAPLSVARSGRRALTFLPGDWTDPSGIRRVLRHRLAHSTAAICSLVLVTAAGLGLGNQTMLLVLAALIAGQVAIDIAYDRSGRPLAPDRRFRIVLVTWPLWFVFLGTAGWNPSGDYDGVPIALVALLMGGLVALVEPFWFAAAWAVIAALALMVGAQAGGQTDVGELLPVSAVVVGSLFGGRLREILETFLGSRRAVIHAVASQPTSGDAFAIAAGIIEPVLASVPLGTVSISWFTDDDRTVLLAIGGTVPQGLEAGVALPAERNAYFRERAQSGPWMIDWGSTRGDETYRRNVAQAGISAVTYLPIRHEGRLIGLLGAALGEAGGGLPVLAEQLPTLVDVAELAGIALGPRILEHAASSKADQLIDAVIRGGLFWPVFQPIRDLATDRIVGYEALSRFDAPLGTPELFLQAAACDRLRDLEIATLRAAIHVSHALPDDTWLSVNSSAELLASANTLGTILRGVRRPIVIELSEHEVVENYAPIRTAIERLGRGRSLAVDDAGAGFASLRHILESQPAYVKLDIGLVHGVDKDPTRRALVAGFVHFAKEAGFSLIAEGIESPNEHATLAALGVELGQGFLLGKPERLAQAVGPAALAS
jgi:EAL domain-containing protein (putative c-di-GMP-specific phosphodiesterase class I)